MGELHEEFMFSRQFLLGPRPFVYTKQWKTTTLTKSFILSTHPNLDVEINTVGTGTLVLLGYIIDPFNPAKTSAEILNDINEKATSIAKLIDSTTHLSGRWVLIYCNSQGSIIFTDPGGMRQVYYHANKEGLWCGSQPEIIKAATGLSSYEDKNLQEFLKNRNYIRKELAWAGDKTLYADCLHLLPNHYLDLVLGWVTRFFPKEKLLFVPVDEAVKTASFILRGSMDAISQRFPVMLAVTSGRDSRVLLAATKDISNRFEYYVDRMGVLPLDHPDIRVPKNLLQKLGMDFNIRNSMEEPPGWFVEIISQSVSRVRILPKNRSIYADFVNRKKKIRVNGNGSAICKNNYDPYARFPEKKMTPANLTALFGYYKVKFAEIELSKWKDELGRVDGGNFGYHILDLLYWEQREGNWGAHYAAEQDIAIEDFMPFNNRLLITTLLSVPREYRSAPNYLVYTKLIEKMWPETLTETINPKGFIFPYLHFAFWHLPIPLQALLRNSRSTFKDFLKTIKIIVKHQLGFNKQLT